MSLPPGFLDELRNRTTLSRVVGRKVTWDNRKSNQAKGDFWAPCPFHQEKTASFHVDDRKGYYYCFGCHAKGDAVSFLREAENMGFMEAIEVLARDAGMPMPERDPAAAQKADRRSQLAEVMEAAVQHYRMQLRTTAGAAARDYLTRRKLTEADRDRFEIGFAPDGWQGLWDHLKAKGIADDLILAAGLAKPSTKGKAPYDVFRNRIMFPIRDARGRCIAFGGRAMDPNDGAKYLNSPETELFDKGRSLYNHGPAREAAGKGGPLIVAEGYMDVIALVTAGFPAAVAPLGTAITENQLRLIWRLHPEPLIMLDGDAAGIRASLRVANLALPMLEAGFGLRFALLPEGLDPDDLIRSQGAESVRRLLNDAIPMVRLIWDHEANKQDLDSPERQASLQKTLREYASKVKDKTVRHYYGEAFRQFLAEKIRPRNWAPEFHRRKSKPAVVTNAARRSQLANRPSDRFGELLREKMILATCLKVPQLIPIFEPGLETAELLEENHQEMLLAILENYMSYSPDALISAVTDVVGGETVVNVLQHPHIIIQPVITRPGDEETAKSILAEQLAKLDADRRSRIALEEAEEDMSGLVDEGLTWRLGQASAARHNASRSKLDDDSDMGEDRAALSAQLQSLIDRAVWEKKRH